MFVYAKAIRPQLPGQIYKQSHRGCFVILEIKHNNMHALPSHGTLLAEARSTPRGKEPTNTQ
jgi:hypothetical protein